MSIETLYRGHAIRFNENSDEWSCSDLGYFSNTSLARVKAKIDKLYLDARKKAATQCFEISNYRGVEKVDALIIEYVGPKFSYQSRELEDHKVAVLAQRGVNERASRRETELKTLMPDTPEAHAAFAEAERLSLIAQTAKKAADRAFIEIPRVQIEEIAELVRVKEHGVDEQERQP